MSVVNEMDIDVDPQSRFSAENFLQIPYSQRWEYLKPTIVRIYMEEKNQIAVLAKRMKDECKFDALPHQYRYYFQKWGIKKRTTTEEKDAAITALGKRSRQPTAASASDVVLHQGGVEKSLDKKQLKRYINDCIRHETTIALSPGIFLRYSLPYEALVCSRGVQAGDHQSPFGSSPETPDFLTVNSPGNNISPPAVLEDMSPTMQLVRQKVLVDRAKLFLEGREQELMMLLGRSERRSAVTWLHDFWIYAFMTAKYWGKGPKHWTPSQISFKSFHGFQTPIIPGLLERGESRIVAVSPKNTQEHSTTIPTRLCRWSIHYSNPLKYESIPSPPPNANDDSVEHFDIDDESTWKPWSDIDRDFTKTISEGLQTRSFTAIPSEELPIATELVTDSVQQSPGGLTTEAFGFAIMSRNEEVTDKQIGLMIDPPYNSTIYPYHLAVGFLDGAKACCTILETLVSGYPRDITLEYIDSMGHTVLDCLFVSVLRSHSTVSPPTLSDAFRDRVRFPGEEVDICGRWDADSPCIRQLYASGKPAIPVAWKHMFCHTSVQAVCHCIANIFARWSRPNPNIPSGLFSSRCSNCGVELKLGTLHSLVLVAFHLANNGMPGENLFGALACLVCLLTFRADPSTTSVISVTALLGCSSSDECQHLPLTAAELGARVPDDIIRNWSHNVQVGWKTFMTVLQLATDQYGDTDSTSEFQDEEDETCESEIHEYESEGNRRIYCKHHWLGTLWAAIQAELLTYRRITETDPWLSSRFDMEALLKGLGESKGPSADVLVDEGMLNRFSRCGLFINTVNPVYARREEACSTYYGNLDHWKRTKFIRPVRDIGD